MKAGSAVFSQIQSQMTILGLPVSLVGLSVAIGVIVMVLVLKIGIPLLIIPAGVGSMVGAWLFFIKQVKDSPHYARELALPRRFWKANKHNRLLNVGGKR